MQQTLTSLRTFLKTTAVAAVSFYGFSFFWFAPKGK